MFLDPCALDTRLIDCILCNDTVLKVFSGNIACNSLIDVVFVCFRNNQPCVPNPLPYQLVAKASGVPSFIPSPSKARADPFYRLGWPGLANPCRDAPEVSLSSVYVFRKPHFLLFVNKGLKLLMFFVYTRVPGPMATLHSPPSTEYGTLWIDVVFNINIRYGHSGGIHR